MATLPSPTQVAGDHFQLFELWYHKLDPKNLGSIQAGPAASFLKKSGLNENILSRIWDISDPGGKGYLDKAGLFVALKLVALVQNGKEPSIANISLITSPPNMGEAPPHPGPPHPAPPHSGPPHPAPPHSGPPHPGPPHPAPPHSAPHHPGPPHPPPPLSKSPGPPLVPAPPAPTTVNSAGVWTITPADRARYDQIFNSLGPEANKIHGHKVRGVMLNSKLATDILGKIWDLADMDKDGNLDKVEFSIAMHLIYKVLENNPLPAALPQEMLSSARRAGVAGQGPVPAPLAPPSQTLIPDNNKLQSSGPPPAPWVVSAADKARYDVMFHNADIDKDGFVSGQEIKGVFLQSGLPQMVLAHIWNLCDMKQTGKLTSEQFALAMWLIQQKIAGSDPPSTLTPEMIPPTMRPKPATEPPVVAKPTYSNPELQAVADEIEELSKDKLKLEADIQQKEASIRLKNNEIKNLQTELDTLSATLKQLENQKGAAQKRLDDLGQQVEALRSQVDEQENSLKAQEEEVLSKQKELNDLRAQEMELEASVISMKKEIEKMTNKQQETLLYISQVKNKMQELQDQEHHMTEVITAYDAAIAAKDATGLSESALMEVYPNFNDPHYMAVGPQESPVKDALSPVLSPVNEQPNTNGTLSDSQENTPKVIDTSFVGGQDPFAQAFGGTQPNADPFAVWNNKSNSAPVAQVVNDPFGGDAFVDTSAAPAPPATTTTKKAKQPPPRPAPPKTRPVKPPPPQINSNNNPTATNDPFGGGGWGDTAASKANKNTGGFADFANFAEFEKYSSATISTSSSLKLPRRDNNNSRVSASSSYAQHQKMRESANSSSTIGTTKFDPFDEAFGSQRAQSGPIANSWGFNSPLGSSGFGSQNGSDVHLDGPNDPFGGDYDPFKDSRSIKEADEFSWDDEADAMFSDGFSDSGVAAGGGKDPFSFGDFSPKPKLKNSKLDQSSSTATTGSSAIPALNTRSKSALGDPLSFSNSSPKNRFPTRSKTSLGNPGNLDFDFDPLASNSKQEFPVWKSNEDLLNENFSSTATASGPWPSPAKSNGSQNFNNKNRNNIDNRGFANDPFSPSWKSKREDSPISKQEQADLDLALALSRSLVQTTSNVGRNDSDSHIGAAFQSAHKRSSRSPSTGL